MDRRDFLRGAALGAASGLTSLACQLPPMGWDRDAGIRDSRMPDASPGDASLPPPLPDLGGDLGSMPGPSSSRYNVLFIALDDLNDWVGCMGGHPNALTPNIDALAREGMLFEQAHCTLPLCCPSRTSILTGLSPNTTGVVSNFVSFRNRARFAHWRTLPQLFGTQGYRTLMGGKIFHTTVGKLADPASWGSVLYSSCGTPSPPVADRYRHGLKGKFMSGPLNDQFDWCPLEGGRRATDDWRLAETTSRFLMKPGREPFFLTCGFSRPHLPWYAPSEFFDMHPLDQISLPAIKAGDLNDLPLAARTIVSGGKDFNTLRASGQWLSAVRAYLACCSFMDACVGRVLTALDDSPYRNNTVVVLFSDHGFHMGEKGHLEKRTLWEESTRVPLIIRVPGLSTAGVRCPAPVSLLDIYPTLTELCGLPNEQPLDGHSLGPLLMAPKLAWPWPAVTTYHHGSHAVRSSRYRYIRYVGGGEELYDHALDPNEWDNLADVRNYTKVKEALAPWLPS